MKQKTRLIMNVVIGILLLSAIGIMNVTRNEAHNLISAPMDTREFPEETPATYNMPFEDIEITTADGLNLVGWFVPSQNGAVIMMQHGYKSTRKELLNEAEMMYRHGYGILLTTVRAHDHSEGDVITFGMN